MVEAGKLLGERVRAQVFGWRDAKAGEPGAPLYEDVPLYVTGTLASRESPRVGTIWSVDGVDVDETTIELNPPPLEPAWDRLPERSDTPWRARLRRRQAWYREHWLGLPPGEGGRPPRPVASMLPTDVVAADPTLNFLCDLLTEMIARARAVTTDSGGIVERHRLYHNLLSSQPLCFNLFANLARNPDLLFAVVRDVFGVADAVGVGTPLFEWAPPKAEHLDSGSAFDCFIPYQTGRGGLGFVGVETKYAENLAEQRPSTNPAYRQRTEAAGSGWKAGAAERLNRPATCQLWYNALLAHSLRSTTDRYAEGFVIMLACADDDPARSAVQALRAELENPDGLVRHATYEAALAVAGDSAWAMHFRTRYLDLNPAG